MSRLSVVAPAWSTTVELSADSERSQQHTVRVPESLRDQYLVVDVSSADGRLSCVTSYSHCSAKVRVCVRVCLRVRCVCVRVRVRLFAKDACAFACGLCMCLRIGSVSVSAHTVLRVSEAYGSMATMRACATTT